MHLPRDKILVFCTHAYFNLLIPISNTLKQLVITGMIINSKTSNLLTIFIIVKTKHCIEGNHICYMYRLWNFAIRH